MDRARALAAFAALGALAACVAAPAPEARDAQTVRVEAYEYVSGVDPLTGGIGAAPHAERLDGVVCTLANDRGRWSATTPARVSVERSTRPLAYTCSKEGFQALQGTVACRNGVQRGAYALMVVPAVVVAAPFAPAFAAYASLRILPAAADPLAESGADACGDVAIAAEMTPEPAPS